MGRQAANTKIGTKRIHPIRVRGGNTKFRALRLESGNFSWGTQSTTNKSRIVKVVYNASNNELVRTNTLVKGCIVEIDAVPFRQWYERHYAAPLSKKKVCSLFDISVQCIYLILSENAIHSYAISCFVEVTYIFSLLPLQSQKSLRNQTTLLEN